MGRINTASKGRRLEHKVIKTLEDQGYICVRSAASKGIWDIIAFAPDHIRCVQVKANTKPALAERLRMSRMVMPANCRREFWVYRDGYPNEPLIEAIQHELPLL